MSANISEEMINAYIDNELDEKDIQYINKEIQNDVQLQVKIEQVKSLKYKIRQSYASVVAPLESKKRLHQTNRKIYGFRVTP